MLGHWRIVLRQAEEAARGGRFEEALALASRSDVADHHNAVQFRGRMALDLIARATRRGASDDLDGAIADLDLAERMGAPPDSLAAARLNLADRVAEEVRASLDSGDPTQALERVEELARHKVGGPALRRTREIAEAWRSALADGRRGEFGRAQEQLDRAERLASGVGAEGARQAIASAKVDLESRQRSANGSVESLYNALAEGKWPTILAAAEGVLALIPEHPAARQARSRAWQQIAAISPAAAAIWPARASRVPPFAAVSPEATLAESPSPSSPLPSASPRNAEGDGIFWLGGSEPVAPASPPSPTLSPSPSPSPSPLLSKARAAESGGSRGRFLLWVDGVGGYLVCMDDRVLLGRAGPESPADVPLMGDISRNHAAIERNGESYLIRAYQSSFVNGKPVIDQAILRDGDVIRLGSTVELEFRQPSPVSATARLAIVSRHRLPLAVDGVLLMDETCLIGGGGRPHIPAPSIAEPVVLYRQAGALWCRAPGAFEVDGKTCAARAPLTFRSSVLGDSFSFSLEPIP